MATLNPHHGSLRYLPCSLWDKFTIAGTCSLLLASLLTLVIAEILEKIPMSCWELLTNYMSSATTCCQGNFLKDLVPP